MLSYGLVAICLGNARWAVYSGSGAQYPLVSVDIVEESDSSFTVAERSGVEYEQMGWKIMTL